VTTVHEEIKSITSTGIVTSSGKEVDVDIIACGTGFEVSYVPHLYFALILLVFNLLIMIIVRSQVSMGV
jgi:hypothetical protein